MRCKDGIDGIRIFTPQALTDSINSPSLYPKRENVSSLFLHFCSMPNAYLFISLHLKLIVYFYK